MVATSVCCSVLKLCSFRISLRHSACSLPGKVSGNVGEVGILSGATLVNSAGGSMEWSAPSTAGWGGTLRNKGTLTFSGTVSFETASDGEGFLEDNARAWPAVLNEVGGEIMVESGTTVLLEWLLWNEGGDVLVSMKGCVAFLVRSHWVLARMLYVTAVPQSGSIVLLRCIS